MLSRGRRAIKGVGFRAIYRRAGKLCVPLCGAIFRRVAGLALEIFGRGAICKCAVGGGNKAGGGIAQFAGAVWG